MLLLPPFCVLCCVPHTSPHSLLQGLRAAVREMGEQLVAAGVGDGERGRGALRESASRAHLLLALWALFIPALVSDAEELTRPHCLPHERRF